MFVDAELMTPATNGQSETIDLGLSESRALGGDPLRFTVLMDAIENVERFDVEMSDDGSTWQVEESFTPPASPYSGLYSLNLNSINQGKMKRFLRITPADNGSSILGTYRLIGAVNIQGQG